MKMLSADQRVWSFRAHSTASAAAFSGERVEQEPITQCHAVPVPTWDVQLWLSVHKDSRLLPSLGAFPQPSAAAPHILPPNSAHTATKLLNMGLRHIHSVNSFIFVLTQDTHGALAAMGAEQAGAGAGMLWTWHSCGAPWPAKLGGKGDVC